MQEAKLSIGSMSEELLTSLENHLMAVRRELQWTSNRTKHYKLVHKWQTELKNMLVNTDSKYGSAFGAHYNAFGFRGGTKLVRYQLEASTELEDLIRYIDKLCSAIQVEVKRLQNNKSS